MKVKVIGRTIQTSTQNSSISDLNYFITNQDFIKKDSKIYAGKAAGICYMPDDYLSNGIQNEDKCLKRAEMNAVSGHYSVYEHVWINFIIKCPKIVAMVLNSLGFYATSEKSARYTKMSELSDIEKEKYDKWMNIFIQLIAEKEANKENKHTDKEIEKLAMENARYMTSVFTETTMEYSMPYNRIQLLIRWIDEFTSNVINLQLMLSDDKFDSSILYNIYNSIDFYSKLSTELINLSECLLDATGLSKTELLNDHKNMSIDLFSLIENYRLYKTYTPDINKDDEFIKAWLNCSTANYINHSKLLRYIDGVYSATYYLSFAGFAQAQRHRTLSYNILDILPNIYIPEIIKNNSSVTEWVLDFKELYNNKLYPQGTMLTVRERGTFKNFALKCKERMCNRAQFEIYDATRIILYNFARIKDDLTIEDNILLKSMIDNNDNVLNRCKFTGYTCKEPCKFANEKDRII